MGIAKKEILRLLAGGEKTGLEMVQASQILRCGTVYVHLSQMMDDGVITAREDDGFRFHYSLAPSQPPAFPAPCV
ncbi:helix-turn-helix domain-containing protein [Mesorhizobium caraganae]|uniref:helix-turn-helix domain-containing protein n=1 Tax=Mesorhizobium caraganae TaxID=483206 RepID=UPI00177C07D0|nr:helix-turn-helix domain-containing protein [Mesorhizobium caraganae]